MEEIQRGRKEVVMGLEVFQHHRYLRIDSFIHGAEPFLRSRQLCNYSRTSQNFIEPEDSLPCSQEPSNGPYPGVFTHARTHTHTQGDYKFLSGFPLPINGNPDNNLESISSLYGLSPHQS
jgi:hypothetical protein